MNRGYRVVYGSVNAKRETDKFLKRLPRDMQQHLYNAMKGLGTNPRPQQARQLSIEVDVFGHAARYRLRVGEYRVLYDVDDQAKTVVILAVRRRSEKTYH
ncbi:MAG: type II toxin-antitoxin system RelE/ParE family toxin [Elusimicrobia bacterium]|nr:type II toxin-antitoxin system RelE/ParE family toxin [Elusimicrobiota bacterium]